MRNEQDCTNDAPLAGMKVVDFSSMIAGPYCSRMLADLGAQVIKIESLDGDFIRNSPPLRDGQSTYFGSLNCGKQSIALDLKNAKAGAIARELVKRADILVENYRPGVMARLGLDYARLAPDNSRLVYCSISGYGQTGPDAERAAYAQVVHAASGHDLAQLYYQDGQDRPQNSAIFTADILTGVFAVTAIQAALLQRERTGRGQSVDATLMESMLNLMVYECQEAQFPEAKRRTIFRPLKARDGFVMVMLATSANFLNLCDALNQQAWKTDPRFNSVQARRENWDELMSLIGEWTAERGAAECESVLNAASVPCARYKTVREAMSDPNLHARGSFASVRDAAGEFLVPNLPYRMEENGARVRGHVPRLGEHTQSVLAQELGMDVQTIAELKAAGAIL